MFPYLFEKGAENKDHATPAGTARARPSPGLTVCYYFSSPLFSISVKIIVNIISYY